MNFDWSKEAKERYFSKAEEIINKFNKKYGSDIKIDRSRFAVYKHVIARIYICPVEIKGNTKTINALKKQKWFMRRVIVEKSSQFAVAKSKNDYNMLGVIQIEMEQGALKRIKGRDDASRGITLGEKEVMAISEGRKRTLRLIAKELTKQPYEVGDVLYIKEAWTEIKCTECGRTCNSKSGKCYFTKVGYEKNNEKTKDTIWKQNLHMPREAAKRFMRIVEVYIERLRDIDEVGSRLEGFVADELPSGLYDDAEYIGERYRSARTKFKENWDKNLSKKKRKEIGWYANPWVWVVEFEEI
jgi:hypothetical protein